MHSDPDPTMHLESEEQLREQRRAALLETLTLVAPDEVEAKFKAFFGAGSGAWSAWDESFIEFIDRHRAAPLLAGKAGAEFFVGFSPLGRAGFWVVAQAGGAHGKGFLGAKDVERLTNLAASRGLA